MPTPDEIAQAEKRLQMSGKGSAGVSGVVIPEIPFHPMPAAQAARNPGLAQWHQENHAAMSRWREQFNAVLARLPEPPATPTS